MDVGALFFLLFLIPCALMLVLMLRGHGHGHGGRARPAAPGSTRADCCPDGEKEATS